MQEAGRNGSYRQEVGIGREGEEKGKVKGKGERGGGNQKRGYEDGGS